MYIVKDLPPQIEASRLELLAKAEPATIGHTLHAGFMDIGMRGILPDAVRARVWKADFTDFVNSGIVRDSDWLTRTLSQDAMCVQLGLVDGSRLTAGVQRVLSSGDPKGADRWDIGDLFGLETWCQVFMADAEADSPRSASSASHTSGSAASRRG